MTNKNIFVAGHNGMAGSAILRNLDNHINNIHTANRSQLNLLCQNQVNKFFKENNFDEVYLAAAKVGGINANKTYPAEFLYENLMIQSNIINAAHNNDIQKLLFLGSSCIYPKHSKQPIDENQLLTGILESSNEPYAIAKIAGIKLCESYNRQYGRDYRSVMPTNLYGPGDNFHLDNSHVIPGLIHRFHQMKVKGSDKIVAWGSGLPMREFLHVDDMAKASIFIMNLDKEIYQKKTSEMLSHINIGFGSDISIKDLTYKIARIVDFNGEILWDTSKPDGTPRKLMNNDLIKSLGWSPSINLDDGLESTYKWYLDNLDIIRN